MATNTYMSDSVLIQTTRYMTTKLANAVGWAEVRSPTEMINLLETCWAS